MHKEVRLFLYLVWFPVLISDFSFASNFSCQKNNENIAIYLYKCCTQTDNHLVTTTNQKCQGQRPNRRTDREQYTRTNAATARTNLSTRLAKHKRATRNGDVNNHIVERRSPFTDETLNRLGLCDMYYVFYRLLSTTYY